jgi:hypothetical protein
MESTVSWYPIGPDFVLAPRLGGFSRLSVRNEAGRQSLVGAVAADPTDSSTIYVAVRPTSGGSSGFRTRDGGKTWTPITDSLQAADPSVDPSCFAVNPAHPDTIYLGAGWARRTYTSSGSRGDTWDLAASLPGFARQIIVDPRTAINAATTVLYAATTSGIYRSPDGGQSWSQVLAGDVWSLAAYMPGTGTAHFYAGVTGQGVFHATDPAGPWQNLNSLGIGLPVHTSSPLAENFTGILVDLCPRQPDRVYALNMAVDAQGNDITGSLYTAASPLTNWAQVSSAALPQPGYGYYDLSFAVAPNSPGDGVNDILFFGGLGVSRSVDAGRTWTGDAVGFHADVHDFAFLPAATAYYPGATPAAGVPTTFVGCDGGIAMSDAIADPTVSIGTAPADYDQGDSYTDTWAWQNLNHGLPSVPATSTEPTRASVP